MFHRRAGVLVGSGLAALLLALLCGCGSNNSLGPSANATSRVRVFNSLENGPNNGIDIWTSDNSVELNQNSVAYGAVSPYILVRAGNGVNANVFASGTKTNTLITSNDIGNLDPHDAGTNDGTFTVAAVGVSGQAGNDIPQILRFIDAPGTLQAGQALIRVINLAPNAGSVLLYNTSGGATVPIPGFNGGGTAYGNSSGYVAITPAVGQSFNLNVFSAGQALLANNVTFTFVAGDAYTVFVYGGANAGQPVAIVIVQDAPITNPT
jgi:hypothetical protein